MGKGKVSPRQLYYLKPESEESICISPFPRYNHPIPLASDELLTLQKFIRHLSVVPSKCATNKNRFAPLLLTLAACLSLPGCAYMQSSVPGSFSTHPVAPITTAAGIAGGAIAGAVVDGTSGALIGAGVGGVLGLGVGLLADSPSSLIRKLNQQGVQVVQTGEKIRAIVYTDTCFEVGTANIDKSCYSKLDKLTMLLKHYGNTPVTVAGYADDITDPAYAKWFSKQQATSLVTYFWTRGIPFRRFHVVSYGQANPIATNNTTRGTGYNRRVEITFWEE